MDCFQLRVESSGVGSECSSREPSTRLPSRRNCCLSAQLQGTVSAGGPVMEARSSPDTDQWGCQWLQGLASGLHFPLSWGPEVMSSLDLLFHGFSNGASWPWTGQGAGTAAPAPSLPRQRRDGGRRVLCAKGGPEPHRAHLKGELCLSRQMVKTRPRPVLFSPSRPPPPWDRIWAEEPHAHPHW